MVWAAAASSPLSLPGGEWQGIEPMYTHRCSLTSHSGLLEELTLSTEPVPQSLCTGHSAFFALHIFAAQWGWCSITAEMLLWVLCVLQALLWIKPFPGVLEVRPNAGQRLGLQQAHPGAVTGCCLHSTGTCSTTTVESRMKYLSQQSIVKTHPPQESCVSAEQAPLGTPLFLKAAHICYRSNLAGCQLPAFL